MTYYNSNVIMDLLKLASQGDYHSIRKISEITVPFASAKDYSSLILVQEKYAFLTDKNLIRIVNIEAEKGKDTRYVAEIYQCNVGNSSWQYIPIPSSFKVSEVTYLEGLFGFISNDNQVIEGTLLQIIRAMMEVVFDVNGFKESEVEDCFHSIPLTVVEPPMPIQTMLDNPSIRNKMIGQLVFDESRQHFSVEYKFNGSPLNIYVETAYRKKAMEILIQVEDIINRINEVDQHARLYTANQLLELKNETWLDEDEVELSIDEFISRMSIETISFDEEGEISIWYTDGDLFWGHSILVSYNKEGQPIEASING